MNKITLYDPDEEYVTKLNYFNINNPELQFSDSKITTYNLNPLPQLTSIIKKDKGNVESFNSKKKLLNELTSKKNTFDKRNSIYSSREAFVNRFENTNKEIKKEKERKNLENKIHKLKEMITTLSEDLSSTISQIESLKLEIDIIQNYRTCLNNNKVSGSTDKENKFKNDMLLYSKSEEAKKIKDKKIEKVTSLEIKRNALLNKISICEIEKKKFKHLLYSVKSDLLVHYHKLLSEGKDTRKEGLSWIIQAIWNLKSNVMLSCLPKYLDENIITFLFKYSSKIAKIKKLENNIKELTLQLREKKEETNTKMTIQKNKNQEIKIKRNNNINESKDSGYSYESSQKVKNDENNKNDKNNNNENNNDENDNNENNNDENNNNENNYNENNNNENNYNENNNNENNNCGNNNNENNNNENNYDENKNIENNYNEKNNDENNKTKNKTDQFEDHIQEKNGHKRDEKSQEENVWSTRNQPKKCWNS